MSETSTSEPTKNDSPHPNHKYLMEKAQKPFDFCQNDDHQVENKKRSLKFLRVGIFDDYYKKCVMEYKDYMVTHQNMSDNSPQNNSKMLYLYDNIIIS